MKKPVQLIDGKVVSAEVKPEGATKPIVKVLRPVLVTRTPEGRIAQVKLALKAGIVDLEIDEPTARALAKLFD